MQNHASNLKISGKNNNNNELIKYLLNEIKLLW